MTWPSVGRRSRCRCTCAAWRAGIAWFGEPDQVPVASVACAAVIALAGAVLVFRHWRRECGKAKA